MRLDHINIRTDRLEEMTNWYCTVLGLVKGKRPPFAVNGAWLYADDFPVVHLVEVHVAASGIDPKIEHFAFSAQGLEGFLVRLQQQSVGYTCARVPMLGTLQVRIQDPDGNAMHIDFSATEAEKLGL